MLIFLSLSATSFRNSYPVYGALDSFLRPPFHFFFADLSIKQMQAASIVCSFCDSWNYWGSSFARCNSASDLSCALCSGDFSTFSATALTFISNFLACIRKQPHRGIFISWTLQNSTRKRRPPLRQCAEAYSVAAHVASFLSEPPLSKAVSLLIMMEWSGSIRPSLWSSATS